MKKIKFYVTILFMICPLMACGIKNESSTETEEIIVDEQEEEYETEINRVQIIEIEKMK